MYIPPDQELTVGIKILPGKSFLLLEKLLFIIDRLISCFLLPRISNAKSHSQCFLFIQVWDKILQGSIPVIAPLEPQLEIFFPSPEILPVNIKAIAEPAEILCLPPDIEVPVGNFEDRDRPDIPALYYINVYYHILTAGERISFVKKNEIEEQGIQDVLP
jgi:hypothetical protein